MPAALAQDAHRTHAALCRANLTNNPSSTLQHMNDTTQVANRRTRRRQKQHLLDLQKVETNAGQPAPRPSKKKKAKLPNTRSGGPRFNYPELFHLGNNRWCDARDADTMLYEKYVVGTV